MEFFKQQIVFMGVKKITSLNNLKENSRWELMTLVSNLDILKLNTLFLSFSISVIVTKWWQSFSFTLSFSPSSSSSSTILFKPANSITRFPLFHSMIFSSKLLERVVTWDFLFTRRANHRMLRTWLSMLIGQMIVQLLLIVIKISWIRTKNHSFRTFFFKCRAVSDLLYSLLQSSQFTFFNKNRHYPKKWKH